MREELLSSECIVKNLKLFQEDKFKNKSQISNLILRAQGSSWGSVTAEMLDSGPVLMHNKYQTAKTSSLKQLNLL